MEYIIDNILLLVYGVLYQSIYEKNENYTKT